MLFESLESRTLFSSVFNKETGVLTIQGTPGRDIIEVTQRDGFIIINFSGNITRAIRHEKVRQINVFGGRGNDRISMGQIDQGIGRDPATGKSIKLAGLIVGGEGKDTLIGGAGNDTIIGGNGGDRITAKDGSDANLATEGNDNIQAGKGNDVLDGGVFINTNAKPGEQATAAAERLDFGPDSKRTTKTLVIPDDFRPDLAGDEPARVSAFVSAARAVKNFRNAQVNVITPGELPALGVLPLQQTVVPTAVGFRNLDGAVALQARLPAGFQYVFGQVARRGEDFYLDVVPYSLGVDVPGALTGTDFTFKLAEDLKPTRKYALRFEGPGGIRDLSPGIRLKFGLDAPKKFGQIEGFQSVKTFGLPNKEGG